MFNSIFRKNKIFKTVLFNITVIFSISIIAILVYNVISPEFIERFSSWINEYLNSFSAEQVKNFLMWMMRLFYIVLIAATLGITYYRIKKVNY